MWVIMHSWREETISNYASSSYDAVMGHYEEGQVVPITLMFQRLTGGKRRAPSHLQGPAFPPLPLTASWE
jgi:hypothetical protein